MILANRVLKALCVTLAGAALMNAVDQAVAATYTFTKIADTSGPLAGMSGIPSINENGAVSFIASLDAGVGGGSGVFVGNGGALSTIATSSGAFNFFIDTSISNNGTVAFQATLDAGGSGIYTGNGGVTAPVAETSGIYSSFGEGPRISGNTVAFIASFDAGGSSVLSVTGGVPTTIASTSGPFSNFNGIAINLSGQVAFVANGFGGVFRGSGGPITTIATIRWPFSSFDRRISVNDAGVVAFGADLDSGDAGVFSSSGGATTTYGLASGPYQNGFSGGVISNAGNVVFSTFTDTGVPPNNQGLFIGPDATNDKILKVGDSMFGTTVAAISSVGIGGNRNGDVVFTYSLNNGTSGVAVAHIPEPITLSLFGSAAMITLMRMRPPRER